MAKLDFPSSPTDGQVYAAPNGVDYTWSSTINAWTAKVIEPLSLVSNGSISGTAEVGKTLVYTIGEATGGVSPYTYSWEWRLTSDNSVLQTDGLTLTIPASAVDDTIYISLTVIDAAASTATGTTDVYPIGGNVITYASFPNLSLSPLPGPNASPSTVSLSSQSLYGEVSGTWNDGFTTIYSTGGLQFSVNGGAYSASSRPISNGDTISLIWDPAAIAAAADGERLTGILTNGTYENGVTITIDRAPTGLTFADLAGQGTSTVITSGTVTPTGYNVPVPVSFAGTTTALTSLGLSVAGGSFAASPQTVNPGQSLQLRGTTGGSSSTTYGVDIAMGSNPTATDTWSVTTAAVTATIAEPSITSPANGATDINPAVNNPAGIQLVGSDYTPLNGAGAQTSSQWEVYNGGYPVGPSSNTITNVTPATFTPGRVQYKITASEDTDPNSQDEVYGKLASDQFNNDRHPIFEWVRGLVIGGFTDWYIPALNELEILYYNLKPDTTSNNTSSGTNPNAVPARGSNYTSGVPSQTSSILFRSGNAQAFSTNYSYWSSTQESSFNNRGAALSQAFSNGFQNAGSKTNFYPARAIRRIPIGDYVAAGSPAIGTSLAGGFYGGQISTAGNGTADYALIVAPNDEGTYGSTIDTNATLSIAGANTDGFQVGLTIEGNTSSATGIILAINGTTIEYLATSGTFVTGETISTDPASYSAVTGSPFTVSAAPYTTIDIAQSAFSTSSTYYARVQYATTNATAATSEFSAWSEFSTAASFVPEVGAAMEGGYFGGQIDDGGIIYNLIVAPAASGSTSGKAWKDAASADTSPSAAFWENEVYGFPASQAGNSATYPAFQWARGLSIGGYNDWYVPAKNELEVLYYFLKPTTTGVNPNNTSSGSNANAVAPEPVSTNYTATNPAQTTADGTNGTGNFQSGGAEAWTSATRWSSTQSSSSPTQVWVQGFDTGQQSVSNKTNVGPLVRAIRRVPANAPVAYGEAFGGGFFAGQYIDGGVTYNLIVAPLTEGALEGQYGGTTAAPISWKNSNTADTNPPSQDAVYGGTTTTTFANATYPLFDWCVNNATGPNGGSGIGGFTDWYIPAKNELAILINNLGYSWTTSSNFIPGGGQEFSNDPLSNGYWSATQSAETTSSAWRQFASDGVQADGSGKTGPNIYARAVRRVPA